MLSELAENTARYFYDVLMRGPPIRTIKLPEPHGEVHYHALSTNHFSLLTGLIGQTLQKVEKATAREWQLAGVRNDVY